MRRYSTALRSLFAAVFIGGGVSHLIQGRVSSDGYAGFGGTALWDWLESLWASFVMPNFGCLTLALAAFGVCLLLGGRWVKAAVGAALAFFWFIFVLGYGFPAESPGGDILKNRPFTVVTAALLIPVPVRPDHPDILASWGQLPDSPA